VPCFRHHGELTGTGCGVVRDRGADSRNAILLANTYASEFARYKTERDVAAVKSAVRSLTVKIGSLQANGATLGRLLSAQVSVLQPAAHASAFRTHTVRNGLLGGALGGLLGIGLVAVAALWLPRKPR